LPLFLRRVGGRWARRVLRHSRSPGFSSVPDYGFGRCDGHHEMVDSRLRKKFHCVSFAKTTAPGCGVDWRALGNPRGNGMASGNATEKRRSSSNPIKMTSRSRAMRYGAATTGNASSGAQFTSANSTAKADHGVRHWPSAMVPIGRAFRPRRMRRGTTAPRSFSSMVGTWWSSTTGRAAA